MTLMACRVRMRLVRFGALVKFKRGKPRDVTDLKPLRGGSGGLAHYIP